MLLRYMPTGKYFQYLLAGFFLSAFLNVPIIGAAIVGVALAIAFYQRAERDTELAAHASRRRLHRRGSVTMENENITAVAEASPPATRSPRRTCATRTGAGS